MHDTGVNEITTNQVSSRTHPVRAGINLIGFSFRNVTMKRISLSRGMFAIVDGGDFVNLSQYKWYANKNSYGGYKAVRTTYLPRQATVYMHRQLMNAPKGLEVDHRNHNTLDNQRHNLRLATRSQNQCNRKKKKTSKGKYKGISWDKQDGMWRVVVFKDNKRYECGRFEDETEAAKAYDAKAQKLFGEFAYLNFPDGAPGIHGCNQRSD